MLPVTIDFLIDKIMRSNADPKMNLHVLEKHEAVRLVKDAHDGCSLHLRRVKTSGETVQTEMYIKIFGNWEFARNHSLKVY